MAPPTKCLALVLSLGMTQLATGSRMAKMPGFLNDQHLEQMATRVGQQEGHPAQQAFYPLLSDDSNHVDEDVPIQVDARSDDSNEIPESHICMKKVMLEEETVWDHETRCHHIKQQNCYQVFKTMYKQVEVEECDEKFKKDCYINYKDVATAKTVEVCNEEVKRDCDAEGEVVCSTQYETVCETSYKEFEVDEDTVDCKTEKEERCMNNEVSGEEWCFNVPKQVCTKNSGKATKTVPKTECNSLPKEVCGPEACPIVKGERKCHEQVRHVVQEIPEEECEIRPHKSCRPVTKIVPSLLPEEECVDVPKEVCVTARVNPTKVVKPVIKKWCGPAELVGRDDADTMTTDSRSG